jgi:hypothetical protein
MIIIIIIKIIRIINKAFHIFQLTLLKEFWLTKGTLHC